MQVDERAGHPTAGPSTGRGPLWLLLLAVLVLVGVEVAHFERALQDDTWISLVYARNLVRGAGLVYNAGEPPVEGYTNFLWTVMAAGIMGAGGSALVGVRVLGAVASVLLLPLTFGLARRLGAAPLLAALAALLLATRRAFALEAVGGLETLWFTLLVTCAVWIRSAERDGPGRRVAAGLVLGAAALTRPEGVLVFGLLELFGLVGAVRERRLGRWARRAAAGGLAFALLVGPHLVFRWTTYGDLVPNTFHAKVSGGATDLLFGVRYVAVGLGYFGPVWAALPLLALWRRRGDRPFLHGFALVAVYLAYVAVVGGDFKPTSRFLLPVLPLLAALGAAAAQSLALALPACLGQRRVVWAGVALALLGAASAARELVVNDAWDDRRRRVRELEAAGRFLDRVLPPEAWIAVSNAGAIPYYADRRTIDMLGLNDRHIGTLEVKPNESGVIGHRKGDGAYVLARAPDAILFMRIEVGPALTQAPDRDRLVYESLFGTSEREIWADPRFREHYRLRSDLLDPSLGYLNWFQRVPERGR